jgi:hypothetical protein
VVKVSRRHCGNERTTLLTSCELLKLIALGQQSCRQVAKQSHRSKGAASLSRDQHCVQWAKAYTALLLWDKQAGPAGCLCRLPQVGALGFILKRLTCGSNGVNTAECITGCFLESVLLI